MSDRTTADLLTWLHDGNELTGEVRVELADRLAELDKDKAALWTELFVIKNNLPPCPTCGGSRLIPRPGNDYDLSDGTPCPDCVDGKVSIAQLVARWNAVQRAEQTTDGDLPDRVLLDGLLFLTPWDIAHYLRSVKP